MNNVAQATLQERLLAALAKAREHYTELTGVHINIQFASTEQLLQAHIKQLTLKKRTYEIRISTKYKTFLEKAIQPALVGWFARELAKIAHYHKLSIVSLSIFKIRYLIDNTFKRKVERGLDMNVIERDLGTNLLDSRSAVMDSDAFSEPHKRTLRVYALTTREISSATKTKKRPGQTLHV